MARSMTLDENITDYIDNGSTGGDFWHDKAIAIIDELKAENESLKKVVDRLPKGWVENGDD